MRSHSHLNTAQLVLEQYGGEMPLAEWLRQFFRKDKKYGSKDRRAISDLCFAFYRLGHAAAALSIEEKMLTALFLVSVRPHPVLAEQRPDWNRAIHLPLDEKLTMVNLADDIGKNFPYKEELSKEIDFPALSRSMLVQPDLFLRLRPGFQEAVVRKFEGAGVPFTRPTANALAVPNGTKVDGIIDLDKEAVVQDLSSQQVIEPFRQTGVLPSSLWDACAASGGKSLLFHDAYPQAELAVSDIRESILANLSKRFGRAGIRRYHTFLADLSKRHYPARQYELVICDAPCSGSGTWARTPEQLYFFKREKIDQYSALQKKIARNAALGVAPGGWFLYITCSVFLRENEAVVDYLQTETKLRLEGQHYFTGYHRQSDTLFAALFSL